jgi:hypothetical protein
MLNTTAQPSLRVTSASRLALFLNTIEPVKKPRP